MLLLETDVATAESVAERLRQSIDSHAFPLAVNADKPSVHLTVSIGVAALPNQAP